MKHFTLIASLTALFCCCCAGAQTETPVAVAPPATSALWGACGEKWTPQSRLPFFALAGYRSGRAPIPDVKTVASVRDFGATGDGTTDDSAAIRRAVEATHDGALFFPAGRYVLTETISIAKSNLVLRGAGPEQSVLVIPRSLSQVYGSEMKSDADGVSKSNYSFSGAFIEIKGTDAGAKLADVAQGARRGDTILTLARPAAPLGLKVGSWIRLQMFETDGTLGRYLHDGQSDAGADTERSRTGKPWINWGARVEAVAGARITLDRPLRLDVRPQWKPQIMAFEPSASEIGIEKLGFEFAGVPKKPHLKEEGFNAIQIKGAVNSWVRDITVTDADIGVILNGTRFCTVENARFRAAKRQGETGHHALWATGGAQDCLFSGFVFTTHYVHDLTVEGLANGNVFRDGSGISLNFDHHRNAPYENLFSNINVGDARLIWNSSGRGDRGPHSAARATFWNIRADQNAFPPAPNWPQINVIGVAGLAPQMTETGPWIEPVSPLMPPDLYAAQRARSAEPLAGSGPLAAVPSPTRAQRRTTLMKKIRSYRKHRCGIGATQLAGLAPSSKPNAIPQEILCS